MTITVGARFGRYSVIAAAEPKGKTRRWLCRCECGTERIVQAGNLTGGHSRSCGCLSAELSASRRTTHGLTVGRRIPSEFNVWTHMIKRCVDPSDPHFHYYGGRGIAVCDDWRRSFAAFIKDMGPRPTLKHSIDRIDNNGPYAPHNCRWATHSEQSNNQRSNRMVTFMGETKTLAQWVAQTALPYKTVHHRLALGWTIERALTEPLRHY